MWDVFISHASEDKDSIARPLAKELEAQGLSVWFDEMTLKLGDSLRASIAKGLTDSRYGIIILSPNFFEKSWTQYELDGLVAREMSYGDKTILPIWHEVDQKDIMRFSPSLANKLAVSTDKGLDVVVKQILDVVRPDLQYEKGGSSQFATPSNLSQKTGPDRIKIARALNTHFNMSELKALCFELQINYDDLPGSARSDKARELVTFMERRGRLPELAQYIKNIRPNAQL